jgi:hypothetical protein
VQTRAKTGIEFEKQLENEQWKRKERKPKMIWDVPGKNVFDKMRNVNYDVSKFNLREDSVLSKYDFVSHNDDTLTFEVKRYEMKKLNKWTLYSEPFFKVCTKSGREKVEVDVYNKFVNDFFNTRKDIINRVLDNISKNILGVRCLDGFIEQHNLEYKVDVVKGWCNYNRITVFFKIKK